MTEASEAEARRHGAGQAEAIPTSSESVDGGCLASANGLGRPDSSSG